VLARVVSLGDLGSEPAYVVEFSTRSGARFQYYFSVKTSLITKITGDVRKTRVYSRLTSRNTASSNRTAFA
jgi:hypothetical protein